MESKPWQFDLGRVRPASPPPSLNRTGASPCLNVDISNMPVVCANGDAMSTLTEQVRQGAEQAWASLSEGWRELRTRASGALTRFQRDDRTASGWSASALERFGVGDWALMAADIRVDDDRVVVRLEAPGMSREDLHVEVDRNRISVWGEKRVDSDTQDGDYRLVQCAYGSFRRELPLPQPVDADNAIASYRDGVLRIEMPRLERSRGRRIEVRGG